MPMKKKQKESLAFWLETALSEIECGITLGVLEEFSPDKQKLLLLEHAIRAKEAIEQTQSLLKHSNDELGPGR